jgi:hypothetical protein
MQGNTAAKGVDDTESTGQRRASRQAAAKAPVFDAASGPGSGPIKGADSNGRWWHQIKAS